MYIKFYVIKYFLDISKNEYLHISKLYYILNLSDE